MARPNLPLYTDPENSHFHPVFKAAAEESILAKGLATKITVQSQFPSPTGPIDLVLFNSKTNKVLLPIEIKRSQSSVRGGGRRQARDYWQNLGAGRETPFYCATNLELVELFRHDDAKPRTSAQRLILNNPIAGQLEVTKKDLFYDQLKVTIEEVLDIILGLSPFKYAGGLTQLQTNLEAMGSNPDAWHQLLIPVCFEYIRGAATQITQLRSLTSGWKSASLYEASPNRLIELGSSVDFAHVFRGPASNVNDPVAFANAVIKEAYEAGKTLGRGDDIAELVNELLATPSAPGIVETDTELAQLLAIVARDALGSELLQGEEVFDPASGSGRLLTALPLTAFPSIGPSQVKANEIERRFAEALSLRLGLAFGAVLSPTNAPAVTISGIQTVAKNYLEKVRLVVMNPPYLSGVLSASLKGIFTNRIRQISDANSLFETGQAALELLFLELVWHLVPNGTVIATVFPTQHLTRRSDEVVALRRFLTQKFALTHIVLYPRQGLFEGVIKQTVLLIGKKGTTPPDTNIKMVEVQTNVGDVDFGELLANLQTGSLQPTHGVIVKPLLRSDLNASAPDGWRAVLGAGIAANAFVQKYMASYTKLESLGSDMRRGVLGNKGNTALTVFSKTNPAHPSVVKLIPTAWLRPVLNTTESMPRVLTATNAPEMSFMPPASAYDPNHVDNATLKGVINEYLRVHQHRVGTQARNVKTPEVIQRDLKSNQKDFGLGWVLIQRASRTKGEVCLLEQTGILLSTNVTMVRFPTSRERKLFASWLLSVFGQIQLELVGTDQEGMRKLEMNAIREVRIPDFSVIPIDIENALLANLLTEPAHTFEAIQQRPSDELWSKVVSPTSYTSCLSQAFERFKELVDERRGFGNS
jgi:hypothetical protein